jgi:ribonuclease HII
VKQYEKQYQEYEYICGIDEVGRGPLAGPVIACAVILPKNCDILYINDSKQLSEKKREELYDEIISKAVAFGVGSVPPNQIDEMNILQATYEAMRKAIGNLSVKPDILLNDAVTIPGVNIKQVPIIKGDAKSISIAAASIVAKVTRDRLMVAYDKVFPQYDFAGNKGYGSAKQIFSRPQNETVRIGSVTVEHPKDYWAITDAGTPRTAFDENKEDIRKISDETFRLSQKLADYGAKIIFWSEGNTVMFEDQYDAFMKQASDFAKKNDVYLLAGIVVLHYDSHKNDNLAVMIDPRGQVAYRYEKTISWYPTDSDGVIRKIDTPYGKIGSAICFDMDFPNFIHQAADVDIMLVPAYDTKKISPFHTEVSFLRGIENGFSVVRQCNAGSSIAADYNGNIIANQDFYTTK